MPALSFLSIYAERIRRIIGEETIACSEGEELTALILALQMAETKIAKEAGQ